MNRGTTRCLIPIPYQDTSKWPKPDLQSMTREEQAEYLARKLAVELYAHGESYISIRQQTGKSESEVRRLVRRCVDGDQGIYGFMALTRGFRICSYARTAAIRCHVVGAKGGGAGALARCFAQDPEREEFIRRLLFRQRTKTTAVQEVRISYRNIHRKFLRLLKLQKVEDHEWPFNTVHRGYNSIRKHCDSLIKRLAESAMAVRFGIEAARRNALNPGHETIVPVFRPFTYVSLDFHKEDATAIIMLENDYGDIVEIPVSRWWIGVLFEERTMAVLGLYVSLEVNPTKDCVLETLESALRPGAFESGDLRVKYTPDGKVVMHQLMPEFAHHGFAVIKMDNAWSNTAKLSVNNVIDTVGCAVNFGPARFWWHRPKIERFFRKLTNNTLQRLPSTHGCGPHDTRKDNPGEQAIKYKIMLRELIALIHEFVREHNTHSSEGLQSSSPFSALQAALRRPELGFFPQPLPRGAQTDMRLLSQVLECRVRGNIKKNERPYIKANRWRYYSPILSRAYHLIGKKLIVYIDRRTPSRAYATVKDTGEDLGQLLVEKRVRHSKFTLREQIHFNRIAVAKGNQKHLPDGVTLWEEEKSDLFNQRNGKKTKEKAKPSTDALAVAKREVRHQGDERKPVKSEESEDMHDENEVGAERDQQSTTSPTPRCDPFGFARTPSSESLFG